jgi:hypothetical protein
VKPKFALDQSPDSTAEEEEWRFWDWVIDFIFGYDFFGLLLLGAVIVGKDGVESNCHSTRQGSSVCSSERRLRWLSATGSDPRKMSKNVAFSVLFHKFLESDKLPHMRQ